MSRGALFDEALRLARESYEQGGETWEGDLFEAAFLSGWVAGRLYTDIRAVEVEVADA